MNATRESNNILDQLIHSGIVADKAHCVRVSELEKQLSGTNAMINQLEENLQKASNENKKQLFEQNVRAIHIRRLSCEIVDLRNCVKKRDEYVATLNHEIRSLNHITKSLELDLRANKCEYGYCQHHRTQSHSLFSHLTIHILVALLDEAERKVEKVKADAQ